MRKMMYNQALFILHKKRQTLTFSRRQRERRESFRGLESAELLDHCSYYKKTVNVGFVLFHLNQMNT